MNDEWTDNVHLLWILFSPATPSLVEFPQIFLKCVAQTKQSENGQVKGQDWKWVEKNLMSKEKGSLHMKY